MKTHGMVGTRFYKIWEDMKGRCKFPKNKRWKHYGGRGIAVCERWQEFGNFKEDMYSSYLEHCAEFTEKETTIERNDSDGNYCKENCRWATWKEQAASRRRPKMTREKVLAIHADTRSSYEVAKEYQLTDRYVRQIRSGKKWPQVYISLTSTSKGEKV